MINLNQARTRPKDQNREFLNQIPHTNLQPRMQSTNNENLDWNSEAENRENDDAFEEEIQEQGIFQGLTGYAKAAQRYRVNDQSNQTKQTTKKK